MVKKIMNKAVIGMLALLAGLTVGCGSIVSIPKGTSTLSRMYDGMYDNNPILVNQSIMKMERIIDSICFLHTDTEFKLEDGEVITAELDSAGVVIFNE
ncbi:MAG: hypothetical protein ACE5KJ_05800, partial [Candidatus Zixiibacteriota bacterium]